MKQITSSAPAATPRRRRWLAIAALLLATTLLAGPALLSATAGPRESAFDGKPAGPLYTIWGTVKDSATGQAIEGAKIRVYRKDPATNEFFGIDGPDGPFITPDADGVWAVNAYEPIQWLVVKLFYEPGWQSLEITGPVGSIINISEARIDLEVRTPVQADPQAEPLLGTLGAFNYTLTIQGDEPTETVTPEPSETVTPEPSETVPPPTVPPPTVPPPPRQVLPLVFRLFVIE